MQNTFILEANLYQNEKWNRMYWPFFTLASMLFLINSWWVSRISKWFIGYGLWGGHSWWSLSFDPEYEKTLLKSVFLQTFEQKQWRNKIATKATARIIFVEIAITQFSRAISPDLIIPSRGYLIAFDFGMLIFTPWSCWEF